MVIDPSLRARSTGFLGLEIVVSYVVCVGFLIRLVGVTARCRMWFIVADDLVVGLVFSCDSSLGLVISVDRLS